MTKLLIRLLRNNFRYGRMCTPSVRLKTPASQGTAPAKVSQNIKHNLLKRRNEGNTNGKDYGYFKLGI